MFTSTAEHNSYLIENWNTEILINFLKEQNLKLDNDDFKILCKEKITGFLFLDLTEEKFCSVSFALRPVTLFAKEVQTLKEKLKCMFSLYKSLKEVLMKYGINEIKHRLGNMEILLTDSNEAMCCEYISTILHASLYIVKRIISDKELTLVPQLEVIGKESTGQIDYAIKTLEKLICIMEGKLYQVTIGFAQNLVQCENTLQVNKKDRKRKSGDVFGKDFDYIYGIITTASEA
ncbi:hypothetical protein GLOIN_2v1502041 [Rhizophagus clarus]|uniref:Uncharacterized protein n=1 Tax=Rhizophagus clarus TaxID=94130 RepID=A0A8H3QZS4_9GLOM|nr:hypothetical protein GLOIN_2v1502041 [Rhizophagus clarus]